MSRRLVLATLSLSVLGCARVEHQPLDTPPHAMTTTAHGIEIHAIQVGQVQVTEAHRELSGLESTRFLRVILDGDWAPWMPVYVYAVVHPERTVLVDTGVPPEIGDEGYYDCDPDSEFFYTRNLRFSLDDGETLAARLAEVGVELEKISDVVITHFHADHIGGLEALPQATVHVGPGNWPTHVGAFTCRLPSSFSPSIVDYDEEATGTFARSKALTDDGRVRIVPLPGHTPGHAGLLVEDDGQRWLIAGDATFDVDQTERGAICGVTEDVDAARETQAMIRDELGGGTVLLPAHDPAILARLDPG